MYVILLALLWLIWLRRGGEKQLVFASRFLTRTGIDLSEDSSYSPQIFDVQGVGDLTNIWLVD